MKKLMIVLGIIFLLILIITGFFIFKNNSESKSNLLLDEDKFIHLGLNYTVITLENCLNSVDSSNISLNDFYYYCSHEARDYLPSKEGVEKLKLIKDIKGINCEGDSDECLDYSNSCEKIWEISYRDLGVRPHSYKISIDKCEDNYYLTKSSGLNGPSISNVYIIDLNKEILNQLKEDKDKCYNTFCYITKSQYLNDSSICEYIDYESGRDNCYYDYMVYERVNDVCNKIVNVNLRDNCYSNSASYTDNSEGCSFVSSKDKKDMCLARTAKELSICSEVSYSDSKYWCYRSVAQYQKDSSICEYINSSYVKDLCYEEVLSILNKSD